MATLGKAQLRPRGGQPIAPRQGTARWHGDDTNNNWCLISQWHQQPWNITSRVNTFCVWWRYYKFRMGPLDSSTTCRADPVRSDYCCWWMKPSHLRSNQPSWCLWWWSLSRSRASLDEIVGFHWFQWVSAMGLGHISSYFIETTWKTWASAVAGSYSWTLPHCVVKRNWGKCICPGVFPSGSGELCGWNCFVLFNAPGWWFGTWLFYFICEFPIILGMS